MTATLVQGGFIAYIAGSSFIFITMDGACPFLFGFIFGTNAIGFIGGAQFVPQLMHRYSPERLILVGIAVQTVVGIALVVAALRLRPPSRQECQNAFVIHQLARLNQ